ncbi:hypothetical protein R1sor_003623 [Riccia sorocarpa]|uniref:Uncharacterized protein n=1 Tax=Riccia sorocarpa TaxID=122646 RepID=A0ABD3H678_9MARC
MGTRLGKPEWRAWILTKVQLWERWLNGGNDRLVRPGSFSWKMKACEPISDNQLHWITTPDQITSLGRNKIGEGSFGTMYTIGFRDIGLGIELGMEGVVPYIAKNCKQMDERNTWVMMNKELASFAETHCTIVRSVACHNIKNNPIWTNRVGRSSNMEEC